MDERAHAEGKTMAEVVRDAIEQYVERHWIPPTLSTAPSGPFPGSSCRRVTSGTVAEVLVDTDVCIDHLEGTVPGRRATLAYSW